MLIFNVQLDSCFQKDNQEKRLWQDHALCKQDPPNKIQGHLQ